MAFGIPVKIYDRFFTKTFQERALGDINEYMNENKVRKLQIGTGFNFLTGWLNTEINSTYAPNKTERVVFLDATQKFPITDQSFDYVFSEHMIEHIPLEKGRWMIQECHRILKPGGKIRITTPNLQFLIQLYDEDKSVVQEKYIRWAHTLFCNPNTPPTDIYVINNFFYNWGHCFIYDRKSLSHELEQCGFTNIRAYKPGVSDDPVLKGIESHGRDNAAHGKNIPAEFNELESLTLEADKPA